jgi:hypothetical protein
LPKPATGFEVIISSVKGVNSSFLSPECFILLTQTLGDIRRVCLA